MLNQLSMFTASADLREALNLLAATAHGWPRDRPPADLPELAEALGAEVGYEQLRQLFLRFGETLVDEPTLKRLFARELLSRRALALHHGRNVYGGEKLALWEALWVPMLPHLAPTEAQLSAVAGWLALDTSAGGPGVEPCVERLTAVLQAGGFDVETIREPGHAPLLKAHRPARGMAGHIGLYGHYDVGPVEDGWLSAPFELTERGARAYGLGIGDNKGALALRLSSIAAADASPELTWLIQGEEEVGSPLGHRLLPELVRAVAPTLWLEENGYHDLDGTQRLLARVVGADRRSDAPPDAALWSVLECMAQDAALFGIRTRVEVRSLNKDFFPAGCPFAHRLPEGARYLAIGINDPATGIHQPNESVPMWSWPLHVRQITTLFEAVHAIAQGV